MADKKPTRSRTHRVDGGPQGAHAWMDIRKLKFGERKETIGELNELLESLGINATGDNVEEAVGNIATDLDRGFDADRELTKFFAQFVEDWNWLNDDGEKLTLPKEDSTVVDDLYGDEVSFINDRVGDILFGRELEKK